MTTPTLNTLTPRERQILDGLLEGRTTRSIADGYGIGLQTVKNYITVVYEKLGVRGRRQLLLSPVTSIPPEFESSGQRGSAEG